tara:strand:- start:1194 stop:2033 length:840 start_codon:yes stop_codon:yes gene_type:complete
VSKPKETSVGETLALARKKKRLRYKKLSTELNIDQSYLIALEEENFSKIPGGQAYVKGFLRAYAKKLDLNPDDIIEKFNFSSDNDFSSNVGNLTNSQRTIGRFLNKKFSLIFIFLSFLILLIGYFVYEVLSSADSNHREPSTDILMIEKDLIPQHSSEVSLSNEQTNQIKPVTEDLGLNSNTQSMNSSEKKNKTLIKVNEECWLEVFTQSERLLYKLALPGEKYSFDDDNLMIITGNFRNVEVLFNDKIVDLGVNANSANISCIVLPAGDCSEFRTPNS